MKEKKDFIINEINQLKEKINNLKKQNNKLKNEINILKEYHNKNPKEIKLIKEITKDSYTYDSGLIENFTVFKSIEDILYLIYSNEKKSIICYDLIQEKIINEIKKAHNNYINLINKIKL